MLEKVMIFDGGFGSELNKLNLPLGTINEELNITNSEAIKTIHKNYVSSGSDFISTNTFGANRLKLKNSKYSLKEIIEAAINNARSANPKYVMLDVGPIGTLIEPLGTLKFDEAYDIFKEIVLIAKDLVDGFILETFTDIYELKAAVLAVKENSNKMVIASMSFEANGRSLTGTTPEVMTAVLEGLGVDVLGVNCSLGPVELKPIVKRILDSSNIPVIVQPNRGLPKIINGKTVYDLDVDTFYNAVKEFVEMGVSIIGGCCGTDYSFINAISKLKGTTVKKRAKYNRSFVTSGSKIVYIENVKIIGERLNPTGKKALKEAIINEDYDYMVNMAISEEEDGADILDVNMGLPKIDEVSMMVNVIKKIQEFTNIPLQIDSSNPKAIEVACRYYNGVPLINSVNGNIDVLEKILPIVKKYGAMVIGLTLDSEGVPKTSSKRIEIANRIINKAIEFGINKERIVIDALTLTAAAEQELVDETLKTIKAMNNMNIKTALGVSNVSFGLPNRALLNRTFLLMALENGLNLPIINPNDVEMKNTIMAFNVMKNIDKNAEYYINNNVENTSVVQTNSSDYDLSTIIKKGLVNEAITKTKELLKEKEAMDIINNIVIPTLNEVGLDYERNVIFLPQLLKSSEATKASFEVIKSSFKESSEALGPVMILTVKGDVHDIGKNIVKVVLESYGYKVIDLGKDVDYSVVIDAIKKHKPKAIGLSALMTTTVVSMEETIKQIRENNFNIPIFVGGAVLTKDIAKDINADYYTKDPLEMVKILKEIL
ncbi:MAG: homocysteine S-methyltransferase family protein [bacterium]|nr:homocysteine S-methyltransferase family protein [bacterium]